MGVLSVNVRVKGFVAGLRSDEGLGEEEAENDEVASRILYVCGTVT